MSMKHPVHPGKIIKHTINATGLGVTESAERLGVSRSTLSRVINEKASLSPEMAVRVSKAFGSTVEHWMRMQLAYDLASVKRRLGPSRLNAFRKWNCFRSSSDAIVFI